MTRYDSVDYAQALIFEHIREGFERQCALKRGKNSEANTVISIPGGQRCDAFLRGKSPTTHFGDFSDASSLSLWDIR